ncbi:MAG: YggT family protein [Rhodospirillaceae bacterium]|nr:YggT family protein [Rhodospirillaceae bacterium]
MNVILIPLFKVVSIAIELYIYALIAQAILSWLVTFNVVNTQNRFVYSLFDVLGRLTEPALRPIRRFLPNLGNIDISPVILILVLIFLQSVLAQLVFSLAGL